jgi:hypothetical protein
MYIVTNYPTSTCESRYLKSWLLELHGSSTTHIKQTTDSLNMMGACPLGCCLGRAHDLCMNGWVADGMSDGAIYHVNLMG